jgi:Predicted transcriptional regulators
MTTPLIESIPIDSLIPYANNSRTHSAEQVAKIAASLREFGWTNPILIRDDKTVIAGHARLQAAQMLRENGAKIPAWPDSTRAPCVRLSHLSEAQARAYTIADNRLALGAGWDSAMLAIEFDSLREQGVELFFTGFSDDEIKLICKDAAALPGMPELPAGDKPPVEQITFQLTAAQAETVRSAIALAKRVAGNFEGTGNDNSNGNALAYVAEFFVAQNADS